MNTLLPKKAKDIKGAVAIAELRRAHYIIVILSVAFAVMIGFVSAYEVQFDALFAAAAVVMLMIVAFVSLATALVLRKR